MEPIDDGQEAARTTVFFGEDGLRAGWCLLLFAVIAIGLIAVLSAAVAVLVRQHLLPSLEMSGGEIAPGVMLFGEGLPFFCIAVAALIMSRVERRPFGRYGLARTRGIADFSAGLLWGLMALSVLIGVLWLTHGIVIQGLRISGAAIFLNAAEWAVVFLLVGLFEEFLFRGYLQFTLTRGMEGVVRAVSPRSRDVQAISFWIAAFLLSGCAFAATHISNSGETLLGIVAVAVAGAVFVFSLWRTGSLWWAIGFHSAWDWAQSFLYGTPDSGTLSQGAVAGQPCDGGALVVGWDGWAGGECVGDPGVVAGGGGDLFFVAEAGEGVAVGRSSLLRLGCAGSDPFGGAVGAGLAGLRTHVSKARRGAPELR